MRVRSGKDSRQAGEKMLLGPFGSEPVQNSCQKKVKQNQRRSHVPPRTTITVTQPFQVAIKLESLIYGEGMGTGRAPHRRP
jgi:hypothetical protein